MAKASLTEVCFGTMIEPFDDVSKLFVEEWPARKAKKSRRALQKGSPKHVVGLTYVIMLG